MAPPSGKGYGTNNQLNRGTSSPLGATVFPGG